MKRIETKSIVTKILAIAIAGGIGYFGLSHEILAQNTQPIAPKSVSPYDKVLEGKRDTAVQMARDGKFDLALTDLSKLHEQYPDHEGITQDYVAVLSWAGHDEESTKLYEAIPADEPDYVLTAIGHSYRVQKQSEKALAAYRLGEQKYPDNVLFVDGEIRSLIDLGKLDEANARADEDLRVHGNRPEIVTAKADVVQAQINLAHDQAVQLGRDHKFAESLALFRGNLLDADHTIDPSIRRDYLAVLGWAGHHDKEVIEIYKSLKDEDQTDFTLAATAKAYRNMHQASKAIELYRQGIKQYPDNTAFQIGEIRCLMDMRKTHEASQKIRAFESVHGRTPELDSAKRDIANFAFNDARRKAALLARQGKFDQALAQLDKLAKQHPKNIGIAQDRVAITAWMGGHDQDVVDQYLALNNPNQPAYVLEAVGKAYRNLGKNDEAMAVYENGLKRFPRSESFAVGTIRTLTDAGYVEKALALADNNLKHYGNRLEVLLAAADAANLYDQDSAIRYYQLAAAIAPKYNSNVKLGLIRTADRMGKPEVALKIISENPGVISDAERRQIEGDEAAAEVRLGALEDAEGKGSTPYAGTNRALATIDSRIVQWRQEGPDAETNILRARYDRILALHNRSSFKEVLNEYEGLVAEGATPPDFTLGAVGDAYLDLHQPEKARDVYLKILETQPKNTLVRRQLFYAYVDLGDYKNAYRMADEMLSDGSVWSRSKNASVPMTDAEHRDAELTAGAARLYFGEVSEAQKRLLPVIAANPDAPASHEALGNLDNAHEWPRAALEEYEIGTQVAGGTNLSNEVGIANTQLALHNFPEAQAEIQSLLQRYPDNASVLRAQRDWDVYNMAELDVTAGYDFEPMANSVNGGEAFGVEAKIYSSPYKYNWRLFAGEYFTHQHEPNGEGNIDFSRSTAGIEYRNGGLTLNLAPTFNTFNKNERVGAYGDVTYGINDHWTVAGSGELFSRNTPLRALNQGVTSDEGTLHAVWKEDETRSVRFGGSVMSFSDNNFRSEEDAEIMQRLVTHPYWRADALVDLGLDQNSADTNRSYYNPSSDAIGLFGARFIQTLYQRYTTLWQHSLQVQPGFYWESGFGADPTIRARYEHRVFFNQTFEAGLGVNFKRQDYDGRAENDVSLTLDLVDHF